MRQLKGIAKEMKSRWLLGVARVKKPECGVGRGVLCCCSEICCLPSALEGGKSRSRLSVELRAPSPRPCPWVLARPGDPGYQANTCSPATPASPYPPG